METTVRFTQETISRLNVIMAKERCSSRDEAIARLAKLYFDVYDIDESVIEPVNLEEKKKEYKNKIEKKKR